MSLMNNRDVKELIKGQSPLDQYIFKRKNEFFYKTSEDIIYKGDLGNQAWYLKIFKEFEKKAKLKPLHSISTLPKGNTKQKSRNSSNARLSFNRNSSSNAFRTIPYPLKSITSMKLNKVNCNKAETAVGFFKKSQSLSFMGNTMSNHLNFIKFLNEKINHLNQAIESSSSEPVLKLPPSLDNCKDRVISLFLDYFDSRKSQQIKELYKSLYGNEDYFQKVKAIKYGKSHHQKLKPRSSAFSAEEGPKKVYIRVVNDFPIQSCREVVRRKYDCIGNAKVMNIPIEFYNHKEIPSSKNRGIDRNVDKMYSTVSRSQRKLNQITQRLFYSIEKKRKGKRCKLSDIREEFNEVEKEQKKLKKDILHSKQFFYRKSPVVNKKIFAFVKDPFELFIRNYENDKGKGRPSTQEKH